MMGSPEPGIPTSEMEQSDEREQSSGDDQIGSHRRPSDLEGSAALRSSSGGRLTTLRFSCEAVRLTLDGFCGPLLAISAQRLSGARDPSGPSAACAGQAAPFLAALEFMLMLLDRVLA
jgi:hypothetical protein